MPFKLYNIAQHLLTNATYNLGIILILLNNSTQSAYIKSNLSWFGPVAVTEDPSNMFDIHIDIRIPMEKCCPGMLVLTSSVKDEIIQTGYKCMTISSQNIDFVYGNDRSFVRLDYSKNDSKNPQDVGCWSLNSAGIYRCVGPTEVRAQKPVYAAVYFFYPCQEKNNLEMSHDVKVRGYNESRKCFELKPLLASVCRMYYNYSMLPNLLGGNDRITYEFFSLVLKRVTNQCHKHIEEILCRIFLPECTPEGLQISPCQSVMREVMLHACKQEVHDVFYSSQSGVDTNLLTNYYIPRFPSDKPCFNVSVTCNEPPGLQHGSYVIHAELNGVYPVNTSVTYICDQNYELDGESTTSCKYTGKWDPIPKCILKSKDKRKQIIIGSALSFVILAVVVSMMLIICYRQEIAIILYAKYGFRLHRLHEEEREFDAFIAYSVEDIAFVKDELLRRLENFADPPFRICIHHRDFVIGDWIANNIINAVTASKRTIIVLSQNFIDSQWCRFEFSQAHFRLIEDSSFKVIVITLGDPKELKNLPKLIKSYLKTGTYIERDKQLFWEKLFYQMPSGHKMTTPEINDQCNDIELQVPVE